MSYYRVNTCRYCDKRMHPDHLVKYGTRAYACFECYSSNKTMRDAAMLPLYEKRKLEGWWWERAASQIREAE
jgi:hypothetical protein